MIFWSPDTLFPSRKYKRVANQAKARDRARKKAAKHRANILPKANSQSYARTPDCYKLGGEDAPISTGAISASCGGEKDYSVHNYNCSKAALQQAIVYNNIRQDSYREQISNRDPDVATYYDELSKITKTVIRK